MANLKNSPFTKQRPSLNFTTSKNTAEVLISKANGGEGGGTAGESERLAGANEISCLKKANYK